MLAVVVVFACWRSPLYTRVQSTVSRTSELVKLDPIGSFVDVEITAAQIRKLWSLWLIEMQTPGSNKTATGRPIRIT